MSKTTEKLEAALSDAIAERDANSALIGQLQQDIENAPDHTTWNAARFDYEQALKAQPRHVQDVATAQRDYEDAKNSEFLDNIVPTMIPLDRATFDNLEGFRIAASVVVDGAKTRDSVAASKAAGASTIIGNPRVQPDIRFPSVDQYRLNGTRSNVVVELCRILEPVFQGLGDGFLAQQMNAAVRSGNRLPTLRRYQHDIQRNTAVTQDR